MDFEKYREADGSIDLLRAFEAYMAERNHLDLDGGKINEMTFDSRSFNYLHAVQEIRPIVSRQLAAMIMVNALSYAETVTCQ